MDTPTYMDTPTRKVREPGFGTQAAATQARDPVRAIAHILRATVIILGLCALLWILSSAFIVIFLSVILAVLLRGLGRALHDYTRLNITAAVLLVFFLLVLALCGFGYWVGPRLTSEGQQLWNEVSGRLGNISSLFGIHGGAGAIFNVAQGHSAVVTAMIRTVASSTIGFLAAIFVIVATGVYFAIAPELYINGVAHLTPLWYQNRARAILIEMGLAMRGWMLGQLIDMAVVGVIVGVGLSLVGAPLAGVLALVAGVLTFIPYFGAIISAIPAIIVALTVGVNEVIWVIAVFAVAHVVEGYAVSPFVQRRTVHLPPALTLLSFVVLVAMFNIFGVLIATPLMAALMVGITRVYVEDILGDQAGKRLTVRPRWYWFTPPEETT
jgi:predicted PurR-regulated permease PerM